MKLKNKDSRKKSIILLIVLALLLIISICAVSYYHFNQGSSEQKIQNEANNKDKQDFIENTDQNGNIPKQDNPENTQQTTPQESKASVSAQSNSDGSVVIYTKLGSLASGSCTLNVSANGNKITKEAEVIYQEQFSSCAGFTITNTEKASLGSGTWNIELSVINGNEKINASTTFESD